MKKIILVGAFIEVIELCENSGYVIEGIVDNINDNKYYGYNVIGDDSYLIANKEKYLKDKLVMVPDKPNIREQLYNMYKKAGFTFETVISEKANISKYAILDEGVVVHDFCNVSANAHIGKCARLNVGANVMHDSFVGDFSVLAPGSVVLGKCKIEKKCYIGANSTILPEKNIGSSSMVGAASVVTKDVEEGKTVIGNPAKELS